MRERTLKIPILTTSRLRLEPLSMAHSHGVFNMWRYEAVQKYSGISVDENRHEINMPASTPDDSNGLIRFWLKAAGEGWGFRWAVLFGGLEKEFVGHLGFNSLAACSEIAYHMNPDYWGKGIMTEAALAAIDWRRGEGITEIEAFIDPENSPSIALALRLGMNENNEFLEGAQRYRMSL